MAPRSKTAVIEELVHHAVMLGYLRHQEAESLIDRILLREDLAPTALGHGLAVPHCEWESLGRPVGVAGFLCWAIPFDAKGGQPVDRIFLTLAPADHPELSVDVLGRLTALSRDGSLRLLLSECQTAEQVSAFLVKIDQPDIGRLDDLAHMSLTRLDPDRHDPWRELADYSLTSEARDPLGRDVSDRRWL